MDVRITGTVLGTALGVIFWSWLIGRLKQKAQQRGLGWDYIAKWTAIDWLCLGLGFLALVILVEGLSRLF